MKKRFTAIAALAVAAAMSLTACTQSQNAAPETQAAAETAAQGSEDKAEESAPAPAPAPSADAVSLKMATGGTTGTYYAYGGVIANILNGKLGSLQLNVQSTGASKANIFLIDDGEADVAIVQNDVMDYASKGTDLFEEDGAIESFSAGAALYAEVCQIISSGDIKSVEDLKGKRVLVRCDFNVPLKGGEISDETRIVAALPTINKLIGEGAKVILCSHLGKVKNGPNEGESLAPVAARLTEKLGKEVVFVSDYNVTGEAAAKAVEAMGEGDVVLLQNTRFRGKEETKNGEEFSKELADLADVYVCDAFGSSHRAHASVEGVTKFITAKGGENAVGYLMQKEIDFLGSLAAAWPLPS